MEQLLVLLVGIIIAVIQSKNKGKKEQARVKKRKQAQTRQEVQQNLTVQMQQAQAAMSQKQRELKARLQQQSMQRNTQMRQSTPGQGAPVYCVPKQNTQLAESQDILRRAAENVSENEIDLLEQQDLMSSVENLMITGYQAKLTYERDFLSEGMDMLNTYTVMDSIPDMMQLEV